MIEQGDNVLLSTLAGENPVESSRQDFLAEAAEVEAQAVVDGSVSDDRGPAVSPALDDQLVVVLKGEVAAFNFHR